MSNISLISSGLFTVIEMGCEDSGGGTTHFNYFFILLLICKQLIYISNLFRSNSGKRLCCFCVRVYGNSSIKIVKLLTVNGKSTALTCFDMISKELCILLTALAQG